MGRPIYEVFTRKRERRFTGSGFIPAHVLAANHRPHRLDPHRNEGLVPATGCQKYRRNESRKKSFCLESSEEIPLPRFPAFIIPVLPSFRLAALIRSRLPGNLRCHHHPLSTGTDRAAEFAPLTPDILHIWHQGAPQNRNSAPERVGWPEDAGNPTFDQIRSI